VHGAAEVVQRAGRASGSAGAMGAMLVLLGLAFWFGASAATVAHWSANLLLSVTFLSLINAVGKA
jgi:multisubunit Na+/H+ antiporter MnhG subunit